MGYIKVEVTQADIDKAIKNNSSKCVVAQAVARTLPQAHRISVDVQTVRFTDSRGTRRVYLSPPAVERYIIAFDAGDVIEPFRFQLDDKHRVNVPRTTHTPETQKRKNAKRTVERASQKKEAIDATPDATPAEREVAAETLAAAETRYQAVHAETAGAPNRPPVSERMPEPEEGIKGVQPRGVKKGAGSGTTGQNRDYGHRRLRINQRPKAD